MIVVIGGATATGKSSLAVEVAKHVDGEIISADSMQIYKGMDVGTAKATPEEQGGVPHYMLDIVSPKDNFNVALYVEKVKNIIKDIEKRGKTAVIVGGTGLYIRSLLYNYEMGEYDEGLRKKLEEERAEKGDEYMWDKLSKLDPDGAMKIHKNNVKRVLRAIEVFMLTGRSVTKQNNVEEAYEHVLICLGANRKSLYDRIEKRVDLMFERGLTDEVKRLLDEGVTFDMQSMQAIGYKEFRPYFSGEKTLEEVKEVIKLDTRHYAKRQETWFRSMPTAKWLSIEENDDLIDKTKDIIIKKGLKWN